uniref:ribonuclease III n=1 Tax=Recilia dorsalis TaxID=1582033 RepID=A0A343U6Z0_RECDO|nr:dicer-1 [Recilia dorsalis]
MAHHYADNVYTKAFTPREYQVELLAAAKERNIIVCLGNGPNKVFISLKLIQELANDIRRPYKSGGKRTLLVTNTASSVEQNALSIRHLTDLIVGEYVDQEMPLDMKNHQVLVMTCEVALAYLLNSKLNILDINLLILDDCHHAIRDHPMQQVMEVFGRSLVREGVKVLGLTSPLVPGPGGAEPGRLEAEIQRLETVLHSTAETASDLVSILRYCAKPRELVLECEDYPGSELSHCLQEQLDTTKEFLDDHRYDPSEIYDDEFMEDLVNIPNPKEDPNKIIADFQNVLSSMGPWCADKAALVLLIQIEKLKVKTPYERHFLLLCLVSSVMLKIRAICDYTLQDLEEKDKIYQFSSPKILRLIEAVRNFKPKSSDAKCLENSRIETSNEGKDGALGIINDIIVENENNQLVCNDHLVMNGDSESLSDLSKKECGGSENVSEVNKIVSGECLEETDNLIKENKHNELITNDSIENKWNNGIPLEFNKHLNGNEKKLGNENGSELKDYIDSPATNKSEDGGEDNSNDDEFIICTNKQTDFGTNLKEINCENTGSDETIIKAVASENKEIRKVTDESNKEITTDETNSKELNEEMCCKEVIDEIINKEISDDKSKNKPNLEDAEGMVRGGKWRGRGRGWRFSKKNSIAIRTNKNGSQEDMENLCAIIFVEDPFTAKILFHLFNELRRCDPDFSFISPQYTVSKVADPITEPREAEIEHRKQEEVLKRFRMRECNILISTSILEEGIDLPKCNLVVRYDVPRHYRSYAQSKGRARAQDSHFLLMIERQNCNAFIADLAQFMEIERMLLSRCTNCEPSDQEESEADRYNSCVAAFCPGTLPVTMGSAIALVNRYCAKLPSDTFTRLTPLWSIQEMVYLDQYMYYCTVRLPINSPVKQDIIGHPMPTRVLAKRIAALETCRVLHESKELDDNLQPLGKESLTTLEEEDDEEEVIPVDSLEPRPGTTKRRQYYYKRIASSLSNCRPVVGRGARLYQLQMILTCPLPEEQNTRGRKLHPPEDAPQGFGILTLKPIPKICPFPIFTRSGEVRVSLELRQEDLHLTEAQLEMIATFLNYTFTSVLRLQKYLMLFDPNASENSYMIVPTKKGISDTTVEVDWEFLELIYSRREEMPHHISDKERQLFVFDAVKYHDAVVMPWYRNQDQPQYFYVAEICSHLNPKSSFPGSDYQTFEEYYQKKYGITVQNSQQPLLDVDHTSARLNFLTPRYVNRKGVALPTSSEETKRAKRENLEQKQILVPELCMIHPFPASLWRQAVCLPCVLYRINALLLADEIRTTVAREISLGLLTLPSDFEWPPLDFGWSLADVLKKSKEENEKNALLKSKAVAKMVEIKEEEEVIKKEDESLDKDKAYESEGSENDKQENGESGPWMEIGTWSNEMAEIGDDFDPNAKLPANLTMVRYGSPTSWDYAGEGPNTELCLYDSDVESDLSSDAELSDQSSDSGEAGPGTGRGLRITFKGDYLAEAEDDDYVEETREEAEDWSWQESNVTDLEKDVEREMANFEKATEENKEMIENSGILVHSDTPFVINRETVKDQLMSKDEQKELGFQLSGYAMPAGLLNQWKASPVKSQQDSALSSDSDCSLDVFENVVGADDVCEGGGFSFDSQPDLRLHPGPSPSVLLQALTMSNANDGINLERLETIGDSFLKYAITTYLYCAYDAVHEGKLSHLRSKQVSNLNLYRLGRRKQFGESMIATKFEPHDNWLPPCYLVPRELERALIEAGLPAALWNQAELPSLKDLTREQIIATVQERLAGVSDEEGIEDLPCFVPYNLITQHSIPDKSIADCVEALIGAYLIACGPRGALLFMSWLGIRVLPSDEGVSPISIMRKQNGQTVQVRYGHLRPPKSPLLRHVEDPEGELAQLLDGYDVLERQLKYRFRDRSYLLQAMTHASYSPNRLTDCYQRLEFLGDAVLDYLITRHLYEDARQHCPGALTDLRSALVNNTIFASLAVRHGFHKYFRHLSPGLAEVVERFVRIQEENCHAISEEYYLIGEEECEEAEDVEVPKALGDVFESVAGAIFLDSGMSLDAVWKVYYRMMKTEIEQFSTNVPKSPIRELLELEPETAKFGKPEKLADGRRVRVTVEVFGKGVFKGIGRNYRIAKCTAAKCALKQLKKRGLVTRKLSSGQHW